MPESKAEMDILDLSDYAPYLIRSIANRLAQSGSNLLMQQFGIGLTEWSCIALLAQEEDVSATRICEVSGFDKGAISRSIKSLEEKGYARANPAPDNNRKRMINLTHAGWRLYAELREMANVREQSLLSGLADSDRRELMRLLRLVHANVARP